MFSLLLLFLFVLCKEVPCSRVSFILFSNAIHTASYTVTFKGRAIWLDKVILTFEQE